jgi:hypothetical protein
LRRGGRRELLLGRRRRNIAGRGLRRRTERRGRGNIGTSTDIGLRRMRRMGRNDIIIGDIVMRKIVQGLKPGRLDGENLRIAKEGTVMTRTTHDHEIIETIPLRRDHEIVSQRILPSLDRGIEMKTKLAITDDETHPLMSTENDQNPTIRTPTDKIGTEATPQTEDSVVHYPFYSHSL